jgi:hypothetical protein
MRRSFPHTACERNARMAEDVTVPSMSVTKNTSVSIPIPRTGHRSCTIGDHDHALTGNLTGGIQVDGEHEYMDDHAQATDNVE